MRWPSAFPDDGSMGELETEQSFFQKHPHTSYCLQDLLDLRCTQPRQFWQFLRAPIRPPVPGHSEFLQTFGTLFDGEGAEPVAADLVEAIAGVCHDPVTAGKVERAA